MSIGPRVRERRKAQRLSQEQLASQAGLTWSAIQRLEAEQVTDPHYSTLSSIAHVLGTTVAELVGEESALPLAR
jgi:transcriptional regulator with XRE-family HTH domain